MSNLHCWHIKNIYKVYFFKQQKILKNKKTAILNIETFFILFYSNCHGSNSNDESDESFI